MVRFLVLIAGLMVSLALAEAVLLFFPQFAPRPRSYVGEIPDRPSRHLVADTALGWRMLPNHEWLSDTEEYQVRYRSNAQGFRDERSEGAREKPRRIALVGAQGSRRSSRTRPSTTSGCPPSVWTRSGGASRRWRRRSSPS